MAVAKSVFRRCLGDRLGLADLVRKDRQSVTDHIAMAFFEGGDSLTLPPATIRITPSVIYITGINEAVQLDTATLILTPDALWTSDAMRAIIRMVPGLIYIKGINEAVVLDTATFVITPATLSAPLKITTWTQLKIEGSLHLGPAPPLHQYYGSVFRRCPADRLALSNLIQWNTYDDTQPRPIATEFWEPGMGIIFIAPILHLTGTLSYGGIDAAVTMEGTIKMVPQAFTLHASAVLEGTIYLVPLEPSVRQFLAPNTDLDTGLPALCTHIKVSRSMANKMAVGVFDFDLTSTGGYYSGIYFKDLRVQLPDHNGVLRPIFTGFFHSTDANYQDGDNFESFPAYDQNFYLQNQKLNDAYRMLLSTDTQLTQIRHREYFVFAELLNGWPKVGDIIKGAGFKDPNNPNGPLINASGDFGKIVYVQNYGALYFEVENPTHGTGRQAETTYFLDGELLQVEGISKAYADGYSLDVTGTISTDPRTVGEWVRAVLGGEDWQNETGIEPHCIMEPGVSPVDFIFDENEMILPAIERVAKRMSYLWVVKPVGTGTAAHSGGYFIPATGIDTYLDLPAAAGIAKGDANVLGPIKMSMRGEQKYNRVQVKAKGFDNKWYKCTLDEGRRPYIDYFEINQDLATQDEVNTRCADVYAYYHKMISTWQLQLTARNDLQQYQLINFTGFGTEIPNGLYRIVSIDNEYAEGGAVNLVNVSVVMIDDFALYLNLTRVFTDAALAMMALARLELAKLGTNETGIAVSVTNGKVVLQTSDGQIRTGAEASQA